MSTIGYAMLHGSTRDRDAEVEAFQSGGLPLFLASLKAGGTGLNLTAAETVIVYDPWWNPAAERQAMDRAHRIGQDKPVFVHRLIAENSHRSGIVAAATPVSAGRNEIRTPRKYAVDCGRGSGAVRVGERRREAGPHATVASYALR